MEFEQLIAERYSVRSFQKEHLSQADVDRILAAGHLAPTGCNNQPQRILVLNTDASTQKLRACTKCHFGAPTAMLVCHNQEESWQRRDDGALSSPTDAVIVATHMTLAAHNIGVGSCLVMHFDPQAMRAAFAIPENVEPSLLLVLGYPAPDAKPLDLHTSFRPLSDVVYYEHF